MNRFELIAQQLRAMPVSDRYLLDEKRFNPNATWTNWVAVDGACNPMQHHRPSTTEEVVAIVKQAYKERSKVKVAGVGHSPSRIAMTNGHMLHLAANMQRILNIDSNKMTVTCEGGCLLSKLHDILAGHDLMLPILLSVSDLTVGGVLSVAGHATGINKTTLSGSVVAMTVVTGKGDVLTSDARTGENVDMLPALACGLGVMGVITQVTLKVEKKAIYRINKAPLNLAKLHATLASKVTMCESYRVWWVPHTDMCHETIVRKIGPAEEGRASTLGGNSVAPSTANSISPNDYRGPKALAPGGPGANKRNITNVVKLLRPSQSEERTYVEWLAHEQSLPRRIAKSLHSPKCEVKTTEAILALTSRVPSLQPSVNWALQKWLLNSTSEEYGNQRAAFDIPIVLPQRATEWAIAAARCLEVLDGLRELIRRHALNVHFIVEIRFTDEDNCWVSPCYKRKTCYIGLVQFRPFDKDAPDTDKYYRLFAEYVTSKGGRPHWAKYTGQWGHRELVKAYPKWTDFLQLQKTLDPKGLFVNEWFEKFLPSN